MKKPEILAPAGDLICLQAALDSGADAVYLGASAFNMRMGASANFSDENLIDASSRCRERGVKLYLTLNTIIFENEFEAVERVIAFAKEYVDAFIVSDWAVVGLCKKHSAVFHISTQMSCSNSLSAQFLKDQGAARIVLARECTLEEVKAITDKVDIEFETFVHGAQCVAESGRCLMSQSVYGCSANRGECRQPCRRSYLLKAVDADTLEPQDGDDDLQFVVQPHTVLSAKDLCSIAFVDKLIEAGITSFKIEGRARNANYVKSVVSAYRRAVDAYYNGEYNEAFIEELTKEVNEVFHRDFGPGLFYGRTGIDTFTKGEESLATTIKKYIGTVQNYFNKAEVAQIIVHDNPISTGDRIQIHGPTTGVIDMTVDALRKDNESPAKAEKGDWITMKAPKCRTGDKVFLVVSAIQKAEFKKEHP